jgi:hypothetical protein
LRPPKILSRKNHPGRGGVPAHPARGQPESQRDSVLKPRVARHELPWVTSAKTPNRNAVAAIPHGAHEIGHNRVAVEKHFSRFTQGSSPLATLGWMTKSLWDFPRTGGFFVSQI